MTSSTFRTWDAIIPINWLAEEKEIAAIAKPLLTKKITGRSVLKDLDLSSLKIKTTSPDDVRTALGKFYKEVLQTMPAEKFFQNGKVLIASTTISKLRDKWFTSLAGKTRAIELELFVTPIAIRILIEIRKHKMRFPFLAILEAEALKEFKFLQDYEAQGNIDPAQVVKMGRGVRCSRLFSEPEIFATKMSCSTNQSALDCWNSDNNMLLQLKKMLKTILAKKDFRVDNEKIRSQIIFNFTACDYPPLIVHETIKIIEKKQADFKCVSIVDPCGGFGGRLVAYLSHRDIKTIVVNDANVKLQSCYEKMLRLYDPNKTKQVYLTFKPAETLQPTEIAPTNQQHDLMLTGWPFFRKELYQGGEQSTTSNEILTDWQQNFLYKVTIEFRKQLKLGGFIATTLQDYKPYDAVSKRCASANGRVELVGPYVDFFKNQADLYGFEFIGTIKLGTNYRANQIPAEVIIVRAVNIKVNPIIQPRDSDTEMKADDDAHIVSDLTDQNAGAEIPNPGQESSRTPLNLGLFLPFPNHHEMWDVVRQTAVAKPKHTLKIEVEDERPAKRQKIAH